MRENGIYRIVFIRFVALIVSLSSANAQAQTVGGPPNVSGHLQIQLERLNYAASPKTRGELVRNPRLVLHAYRNQDFAPLWTAPSGWLPRAHEMLEYIGNLHQHGLSAEDYHLSALRDLAHETNLASQVHSELLLSDAFVSLTRAFQGGRPLFPEQEPFEKNTTRLLLNLKRGAGPSEILNAQLPESAEYWALSRALKALIETTDSASPTPAVTGPIDRTTDGPRIGALSARLRASGEYQGPYTERFEDSVQQALKRFQTRYGLDADGIPGPATLEQLNAGRDERVRQVIANLARLRTEASATPPSRIDVNIAAQELRYYHNGKLALHMPVIVGRTDRPTPELQSAVKEVVFNPDWTVPYRIAVRDKLPQIQREPGYLAANNFSVYADWSADAPIIAPESVNWNEIDAGNFPFVLRQAPGPNNALGQVKFLFDNPYAVYLHDTPTKSLFSKEQRLFSSGCIRLAEPLALAELLLHNHGEPQDFTLLGGNRRTQSIILREPVPVRIRYQTAWVDPQGILQFRADVYRRDTALFAQLEQNGQLPSLARLTAHIDVSGTSTQIAQVEPANIF